MAGCTTPSNEDTTGVIGAAAQEVWCRPEGSIIARGAPGAIPGLLLPSIIAEAEVAVATPETQLAQAVDAGAPTARGEALPIPSVITGTTDGSKTTPVAVAIGTTPAEDSGLAAPSRRTAKEGLCSPIRRSTGQSTRNPAARPVEAALRVKGEPGYR